jgi:hypothetical protein
LVKLMDLFTMRSKEPFIPGIEIGIGIAIGNRSTMAEGLGGGRRELYSVIYTSAISASEICSRLWAWISII